MHSFPLGLSSPSERASEFTPTAPSPGRNEKLQVRWRSDEYLSGPFQLEATKDSQGTVLPTVLRRAQYRVHM